MLEMRIAAKLPRRKLRREVTPACRKKIARQGSMTRKCDRKSFDDESRVAVIENSFTSRCCLRGSEWDSRGWSMVGCCSCLIDLAGTSH